MRSIFTLVLVAGFAAAAPVPKALKANTLDGTWEIVEILQFGEPLTRNNRGTWEFDGEKLTQKIRLESGTAVPGAAKVIYRNDLSKGAFDYTEILSDGREQTFPAYFERSGDSLKIAYATSPKGPRPEADSKGQSVHIFTFKRSER